MPFDFGEDRLREWRSLPATFYVETREVSMTNDNCRTFKPVSYTHLDVYKRQVFCKTKRSAVTSTAIISENRVR